MKKIMLYTLLCGLLIPANVYAEQNTSPENKTLSSSGTQKNIGKAFEQGLRQHLGLNPEETKIFLEMTEENKKVQTELPLAQIKNKTRRIEFSGMIEPVTLTPHYVGALAFFDATGSPWNVSKAIIGSSQNFDVISNGGNQKEADPSIPNDSHIIYITTKSSYANSNLVVYLQGAKQPFIIPIKTSSERDDSRIHDGLINFRVDGYAPYSKINPIIDTSTAINTELLDILDGVSEKAKIVKNDYHKNDVRIYELDNKYYIKTSHQLIYPASLSNAAIGDNKVFEINKIPSIIMSIDGEKVKIDIK